MNTTNRRLSAAEILGNVGNLKKEIIACPEWGGMVEITELTAGEATEIGKQVNKEGKDAADDDAMIRWVIASVINEDGTRTFQDSPENRKSLRGLGAGPIMRIGNAALKLNGFAEEAVKDTTKNSEANQTPG